MSRALHVVARLRKLAIDEARRELAAQLAVEAAATGAEQAAADSMRTEHEVARALPAEDVARAAFAAWLPRGLKEITVTREASAHAQEATGQARVLLGEARAAKEAVAKMLARELAERLAEANRREQAVLDEVGATPPPSRPPSLPAPAHSAPPSARDCG